MLSVRAFLLFFALISLTSKAWGQSQPPPPAPPKPIQQPEAASKDNQARPENNLGVTEPLPAVVKVLPPNTADKKTAEEGNQRHDYSSAEWWLVYLTAILVSATIGLMIYTGNLWRATVRLSRDATVTAKRQAEDMKKSLHIADVTASAAHASALSAERLVKTMEDTADRQLRAYVFVYAADIEGIDSANPPEAVVVIKNSGQTPAFDVLHVGGIGFGKSFDTLSAAIPPDEITRMTLPPGGIWKNCVTAPRRLSTGEKSAIHAGTMIIFVYGEIRYKDAFDKPRFTKYRFMIGGSAGMRGSSLSGCAEGNEAN